ncbi:MAG TPA: signal peptide peptidase SppA [Bacillota bacterium]
MQRRHFVILILLTAVGASVVAGFFLGPRDGLRGLGVDTVGIVYIDGEISGGASTSGLFGGTLGSDNVIAYLKEARENPLVKAVVLRVNSPGGSAAAAQEISNEVAKLRADGKKVVTSMGDVAASGAYWVASGTDLIIADPATLTGSIGVIMEVQNVQELYKKLGIDVNVIKSAPMKDIGSSTRPMTPEERALLQTMVNDIFDQFVIQVSDGRKLSREAVLGLADGRVFTGRQAKSYGLIDGFGNFHDAIDQAVRLAGIRGRYSVKEYGVTSPWAWLTGPQGILRQLLGRVTIVGPNGQGLINLAPDLGGNSVPGSGH